MEIIDIHAHLTDEYFDPDREQVIARAKEAGVSTIICAGSDPDTTSGAVRLAEKYDFIYATAGIHPNHSKDAGEYQIERIDELANHRKVVAIGEIGLDYYRESSPRQKQLEVIRKQLELALRLDLPVVVHCRRAEEDMLPLLKEWTASSQKARGVIHCFSRGTEIAKQYLEMGFYLSFGAYVTYPKNTDLQAVIREIPLERMVIETDAPYLPPQDRRGQRNESSYMPQTLAFIAQAKEVPAETIAVETTKNARRLFRLPVGRT
jgi:TatD DNase family protein